MESLQTNSRFEDNLKHSADEHDPEEEFGQIPHSLPMILVNIKRRIMRLERRKARAAELSQQSKETDNHIVSAAIECSKGFDTTITGQYSIWRKEYQNPNYDSTLKLMRDQIIMAKSYSNIAKSNDKTALCEALVKHSRDSKLATGDASSDAELQTGYFVIDFVLFLRLIRALDYAKAMGHVLSVAKDRHYDCILVARKLRAMLQSTENRVNMQKKISASLIQLAAKTVPRPLHCLPLNNKC